MTMNKEIRPRAIRDQEVLKRYGRRVTRRAARSVCSGSVKQALGKLSPEERADVPEDRCRTASRGARREAAATGGIRS